jgi:hypothetical protein
MLVQVEPAVDVVTGDQLSPRAVALEWLRAVATPGQPTAYAPMALLATRDLVEAVALAGALEGMEPLVAREEPAAIVGTNGPTSCTAPPVGT